jgi:hypothetical protein
MLMISGCGKKENKAENTATPADATVEPEEIAVQVLDNDMLTLTYTGIDEDGEGILFLVQNKTDKYINVYFNTIVVDGRTEEPMMGIDIEAGDEDEYICDVSEVQSLSTLTGILVIDDEDGNNLDSIYLDKVSLSDASEDTSDTTPVASAEGLPVVLDNDKITVSYAGTYTDEEEQGLIFNVYNKTDSMIETTFDTLEIDGNTEEPSYVVDIMSGTYGVIQCDVEGDISKLEAITADISIYYLDVNDIDSFDENNMDSFNISGASIK